MSKSNKIITAFFCGDEINLDFHGFPHGECEKEEAAIRALLARVGVITNVQTEDKKDDGIPVPNSNAPIRITN